MKAQPHIIAATLLNYIKYYILNYIVMACMWWTYWRENGDTCLRRIAAMTFEMTMVTWFTHTMWWIWTWGGTKSLYSASIVSMCTVLSLKARHATLLFTASLEFDDYESFILILSRAAHVLMAMSSSVAFLFIVYITYHFTLNYIVYYTFSFTLFTSHPSKLHPKNITRLNLILRDSLIPNLEFGLIIFFNNRKSYVIFSKHLFIT